MIRPYADLLTSVSAALVLCLVHFQVNVGCVPKKVMWNAAFVKDVVDHAGEYGHNFDMGTYSFDWGRLKKSRDGYVQRLNGIYANNLKNSGVTLLRGFARFEASGKVVVEGDDGGATTLSADHILIATGGAPIIPADVPGAQEFGIDSDGFFELEALPKKVAVVGAGYIAVELAGMLNQLGSECELFVRNQGVLRTFDADIAEFLNKELVRDGIELVTNSCVPHCQQSSRICWQPDFCDDDDRSITKVEKEADGTLTLSVYIDGAETNRTGYDKLIYAIGRSPAVSGLGLAEIGVKQDFSGHILVNEYQETGVAGIYALGDVCGIQELTPVRAVRNSFASVATLSGVDAVIATVGRWRLQRDEGCLTGCLEDLSTQRRRSNTRRCRRLFSPILLSALLD